MAPRAPAEEAPGGSPVGPVEEALRRKPRGPRGGSPCCEARRVQGGRILRAPTCTTESGRPRAEALRRVPSRISSPAWQSRTTSPSGVSVDLFTSPANTSSRQLSCQEARLPLPKSVCSGRHAGSRTVRANAAVLLQTQL